MEKIKTNKYGIREIIAETPIEDTDLSIAVITLDGADDKKYGIIDENLNEVVAFGEFDEALGIRQANNTVIVDCLMVRRGVNGQLYGSFICTKQNGKYTTYKSDAAIALANEHMIFGANFKTDKDIRYGIDCPVLTYEYDYKLGSVVHREELDNKAYLNGGLQEYLRDRCLPSYPGETQGEKYKNRMALLSLSKKFEIYRGNSQCAGIIYK